MCVCLCVCLCVCVCVCVLLQFAGVSSSAGKIGAIIVGGLIAGQHFAGMDTTLAQHCAADAPGDGIIKVDEVYVSSHAEATLGTYIIQDCIEGAPDVDAQPESAIFYIRSMYMFIVPALNLIQVYAILQYPIKGERLRLLEEKQGKSFALVSEPTLPPPP